MKKDFRKKVIEYRNNKDTDFISTNSQKITEKLLSMNCIKDANTIMLYLDFNNEVKTDQLITKLISLRKTVTSPITIVEDRVLIPAQITDLENGIKVGAYNIREPKPDAPTLDVKDLDLVITGAEYGTGKRSGWLSSFILSCMGKEEQEFLEIGRVGTGIKAVSYTHLTLPTIYSV